MTHGSREIIYEHPSPVQSLDFARDALSAVEGQTNSRISFTI